MYVNSGDQRSLCFADIAQIIFFKISWLSKTFSGTLRFL